MNYSRGKLRVGQEYLQAIACPRSNRLVGGSSQAIAWLESKRLVNKNSQKVQKVKHKYNTPQLSHNTSIAYYNIIQKYKEQYSLGIVGTT